ncbi:MAG: type III secretion system chaperone [Pseudomonadota bacterium]
MATIEYIRAVAQGRDLGFSIALPDENGISKTAINDSIILYIVASPDGPNPTNELDCAFLYAPLLSVHGLPDAAYKKLFIEVGKYGLPFAMSPGMRLGFEENSELLWVCQRVVGSVMSIPAVTAGLQRFVQETLRIQPLLTATVAQLAKEFAHGHTASQAAPARATSYAQEQQYAESYETSQESANNVGSTYGTYTATVNDSEITSLQLMSMGYALRI